METTIILSKVLGLYILIAGVVILARREYFIPIMGHFVKERILRLIVAFCELLAGLFLVVLHFDFSTAAAGIITCFGILAAVEGTAYLVLPDRTLDRAFTRMNKPVVYICAGIGAVMIGIYLAGYGFGLVS